MCRCCTSVRSRTHLLDETCHLLLVFLLTLTHLCSRLLHLTHTVSISKGNIQWSKLLLERAEAPMRRFEDNPAIEGSKVYTVSSWIEQESPTQHPDCSPGLQEDRQDLQQTRANSRCVRDPLVPGHIHPSSTQITATHPNILEYTHSLSHTLIESHSIQHT